MSKNMRLLEKWECSECTGQFLVEFKQSSLCCPFCGSRSEVMVWQNPDTNIEDALNGCLFPDKPVMQTDEEAE
ncbi:hypothetical protein [Geomicrobium sp. JCM 19038]|uniref:hypothetical protein n=1 Tax=Geomicrobium sp. JCM 19038 TaxID=1460635 RepID=UPI00045F2527|nr:hypothetical protein [Geomicrobium sp. JCM 19038]GAK08982.1 hypothetical protein JCM19038_2789 [Geomicrobium sp. JCM 19038]